MHDGTRDEVSVTFPASPDFTRIGRVAVAGLALRLGVDIAEVEQLRLAVDRAVEALHGRGRIQLRASWQPSELVIVIGNPDEPIDATRSAAVTEALAEIVDRVEVAGAEIRLTLTNNGAGPNGNGRRASDHVAPPA
jgi:hypothetical protein